MNDFTKYMHLERLGTSAVNGIEIGTSFVFPKLDGTNASVWLDGNDDVCAGSRNRQLSLGKDNAGFYQWAISDPAVGSYFAEFPDRILYGEWLVPHSLKTYRDDAWRRFYVFDVVENGMHLPYDYYAGDLERHGLDYLSPLALVKNGTREDFEKCLEMNTFGIQDGKGIGEGVVIKNYDFVNRFGNVVWAKLIANTFREEHHKVMGGPLIVNDTVEEKIVEEFVTDHLVQKSHAKISNEEDGWTSRKIPKLLGLVWHDLVTEEIWEAVKKFKNPKIDFGRLQKLCNVKVKETLPEVFA